MGRHHAVLLRPRRAHHRRTRLPANAIRGRRRPPLLHADTCSSHPGERSPLHPPPGDGDTRKTATGSGSKPRKHRPTPSSPDSQKFRRNVWAFPASPSEGHLRPRTAPSQAAPRFWLDRSCYEDSSRRPPVVGRLLIPSGGPLATTRAKINVWCLGGTITGGVSEVRVEPSERLVGPVTVVMPDIAGSAPVPPHLLDLG